MHENVYTEPWCLPSCPTVQLSEDLCPVTVRARVKPYSVWQVSGASFWRKFLVTENLPVHKFSGARKLAPETSQSERDFRVSVSFSVKYGLVL